MSIIELGRVFNAGRLTIPAQVDMADTQVDDGADNHCALQAAAECYAEHFIALVLHRLSPGCNRCPGLQIMHTELLISFTESGC